MKTEQKVSPAASHPAAKESWESPAISAWETPAIIQTDIASMTSSTYSGSGADFGSYS